MEIKDLDSIKIKDLEVYANHGVLSEENNLGQKFYISAELFLSFDKAIEKDDINFSVNYSDVCNIITKYMQENTFNLIESVASNLIFEIMDIYPIVNGITIELKKPWAPIRLSLKNVSVKIKRFRHEVYISLGSNIGDKNKYITDAIEKLGNVKGCRVDKVSSLMITKPYGYFDQDDFLNCVLKLNTILSPHELLACIQKIEHEAKRERTIRWGPRTLDLDILFYDNNIIDDEYLHIPHIDMHNRKFILEPLSEIAPFVRHPVFNKTVKQLLEEIVIKDKK